METCPSKLNRTAPIDSYLGSISGVKVSVSLPDEDVAFLDDYARHHQIASRSATLHQAIRLLRASELAEGYADAFTQWGNEEHTLCDSAVSKAQAEQVRSISVERVGRLIGHAPFDVMAHLDDALRLHLAL